MPDASAIRPSTDPAPGPALRCRGVRLGLAGRPILDGIDLDAASGAFVAILGPSGCGKSTLLRVLAGLQPADAGDIAPPPRVGAAALMPQADCLLPWLRLVDNVALGPGLARRPGALALAAEGLRQVGLADFARSYPAALSGGMRQRAALLRTVLGGPRLLLLDEPFGALDSLTRLDLQDWLERLWLGGGRPSVVLVTHDVGEAVRLADAVVVLSPRPARVVAAVAVPGPRPRPAHFRTSPTATALQADLLGALGVGGGA